MRLYKLGGCRWKFLLCPIILPSSPERESATRGSESSSRSNSVDDVFQQFKTYVEDKVLSSDLGSQTVTETQKLKRAAEAEKLKLAGNKDQILFNSELSTAVDEVENLAAKDIPKAHEKLAQLSKSLKLLQKIIKLADKSEAWWLTVKEYKAEELASNSEVEKRIRKAQKRALRKKISKMQLRRLIKRKVHLALLACSLLLMTGRFFEVLSLPFL